MKVFSKNQLLKLFLEDAIKFCQSINIIFQVNQINSKLSNFFSLNDSIKILLE